jgi:hypothetical protein
MTKKDYIKFAAMFANRRAYQTGDKVDLWERLVYATADIFAADNDRFDRARFLSACGLTKD